MEITKLLSGFDSRICALSHALGLEETAVREALLRAYSFDGEVNDYRLKQVFEKAARGEAITVAGLGGSITAGASAKSYQGGGNNARAYTEELGGESCWFNRTVQWFADTFPETEVKGINAGIGATPSFLGTFRLEQMVLQHKPDLVFVEFSVNDPSTFPNLLETEIFEAYESVVRKCLDAGVAVVQIFMNDRDNNGLQRVHSVIAQHYKVPSISYHNAVYPEGKLICDWTLLSPDEIHPNNAGHAFLATCICNYLETVKDTAVQGGDAPIPENWLHKDTFYKVCAIYADQLKETAEGALSYHTDTRDCGKWFGTLVSEGVGSVHTVVPKGAKRVWVQFYYNQGSFETDLGGMRSSCNTAPVGWPRPMWHRIYTGNPLEGDTPLCIRSHKAGSAIIMGVLIAF